MRWLDLVARDPVPWLLDPVNPSARLLTLQHLFNKPATSLTRERDRLLVWAPIESLLEHWNPINFWGRETAPYFGGALGNFGTLYLLSQLGIPRFTEIDPTCENFLNTGRRSDGRFSPERNAAAPWLCYTGMALQLLWHFGYGNDLRTQSTRAAMVQTILLHSEVLECPIAGGDCQHGIVKALLGLLSVPSAQRTVGDTSAIEMLCEKLVSYPFDFDGRDAEWVQPTFPRYYRSDLVELCHTLGHTSYRTHHRYQELLQRMLTLQNSEGRWHKLRPTPALSVERIQHPSRWVTFEAVHALILAYGDSSYSHIGVETRAT